MGMDHCVSVLGSSLLPCLVEHEPPDRIVRRRIEADAGQRRAVHLNRESSGLGLKVCLRTNEDHTLTGRRYPFVGYFHRRVADLETVVGPFYEVRYGERFATRSVHQLRPILEVVGYLGRCFFTWRKLADDGNVEPEINETLQIVLDIVIMV